MIFFLSKFWDLRFIVIFLSSIILRIIPRSQNCYNFLSIILRSRNNSQNFDLFLQNSDISDLLKFFSIILRIILRSQIYYNFLSIILRSHNNSQNFDLFFLQNCEISDLLNLKIIPRSQIFHNFLSIILWSRNNSQNFDFFFSKSWDLRFVEFFFNKSEKYSEISDLLQFFIIKSEIL